MQQNHVAFCNAEQYPRDPVAWKAAADLPQSAAHRTTERQAHGPGVLHVGDVLADDPTFLPGQGPQPFPHWLGTRFRAVERGREFLESILHPIRLYQK